MKVVLPKLHPAQRVVFEDESRFRIVCSGRRWGKTNLAVVIALVVALHGGRVWIVAPTYSQSEISERKLTNLLSPYPALYDHNRAKHLIELATGGEVWFKTAANPKNLRGEGLDLLVLDEAAYIPGELWNDVLRPALSDKQGDALLISTPSRRAYGNPWFAEAFGSELWSAHHYTSYDNPHVPDEEIDAARESITEAAFRREYLAEFDTDPEGALWLRKWFDRGRVTTHPDLTRLVIGVDPSGGGKDEAGIIAAGRSGEDGYVLEDKTANYQQAGWADEAVALYHKYDADAIVAEANYGGDMVVRLIRQIDGSVPVKKVHASRGKTVRAEPVASLYKQEKIHHVGRLSDIEDELATWTPDDRLSPGRLDATVWAFTELFDINLQSKRLPIRAIPV